MKKIIITSLALLGFVQIYSQTVNDALNYSQDNITGTARFRSMGGAFGALGGDLSSMNVNPAGSVIFANSQVGITLSNFQVDNKTSYFGNTRTTSTNSFDLNQAGGVFVFDLNTNSGWKKFAFSVNFEDNKNFDNNVSLAGINTKNSITNYFLSYANGVPLSTLNDFSYTNLFYNEQQAYLGYNAFIIDPVNNTPSNSSYTSGVVPGKFNQESIINTRGTNGKATFNFAAQYEDTFSIGLNLNSHFSDFRQNSSFLETNTNNLSTTDNYVNRIRFNNEIYTKGSGFSFQLGAIYKPIQKLRLGLAFESPICYQFTDEISQNISATSGTVSSNMPANTVNPSGSIILEPYNLRTPLKLTGSVAYVFGKQALLSLDVSTKDYSSAQFRPENDFRPTNNQIKQNLNSSTEIRLGGEYKIKRISLRGGYRWEESPYKLKSTMGDLTAYSGGLGYNFGSTKLDLAYSRSKRFTNQALFSQGFTDAPNISTVNNSVTLTLLFEL